MTDETNEPQGTLPEDRPRRVILESAAPEIDCGRFPIKRTVGEEVVVEVDAFTDGHDAIACALLYRAPGEAEWREVPMEPLGNDRWRARFTVDSMGRWRYTVEAWVDCFESWRRDLEKRLEAGQDLTVDLAIGAGLLREVIDDGLVERELLNGFLGRDDGESQRVGILALGRLCRLRQ